MKHSVQALICTLICAALLCGVAPVHGQQISAFYYDQRVISPTSAITFNISVSGWTLDSMTITVDGTAYAATIDPISNSGSYIWDASGATNPSEHFVSATADVHTSNSGGTSYATLDSTAGGADGRAADFVIANLSVQYLTFNGSYPLLQDAVTAVPFSGITWYADGSASSDPVAYKMNTKPGFTIVTNPTTGNALTGFTCTLDAVPGNWQDPTVHLYSSVVNGVEQVTPYYNDQITCLSQNALYGMVAGYTYQLLELNLYVGFTLTGNWGLVSSFGNPPLGSYGDEMFGLLADPTAPMTQPWLPILNDACSWAYGTTDSTSATKALTEAAYNNCNYFPGLANTNTYNDTDEDFYLLDFLYGASGRNTLTGECNDFADFLVCLSNGVGARPLRCQRSTLWADYINHHSPDWCYFWTNPITSAHQQDSTQAASVQWNYHQWAIDGGIFDGSERLGGTVTPEDYASGNWFAALVDATQWYHWSVQPVFMPTVLNNRPAEQ